MAETATKPVFEKKVDTKEARDLLGLKDTRTVTRLILAGKIRAYKVAQKWMVSVASIEEYLESVKNSTYARGGIVKNKGTYRVGE